MKKNLTKKIALILAIILVLGCFSGCKTAGSKAPLQAVIDTSGLAGTEIVIDLSGNNGTTNPDQQQPDTQQPDVQQPDTQTPDVQEPDTQQPDVQEPDTQEPDVQEPSGENGEENNGGEDEPAVQKPAYDPAKALKIVCYNIKCAWYSKTIDQVAAQLKEENADIVGLQEVDCNTSRSKGINQTQVIAEKAGYPYYYFEPVIDLTNPNKNEKAPDNLEKNAYGHAILSKYPIKKSNIIWPKAQVTSSSEEVRNFGRHEIDVNGKTVVVYNGHLNFSIGREQYFEIQENYMSKDKYAICMGDFNETHEEFGAVYFDNDKYYNFSFGEDGTGGTTQVYRGEEGKKSQVIDHIIVTRDTFVWKDDEVQNGYYVREHDGASDHNMIYCYVNLLD